MHHRWRQTVFSVRMGGLTLSLLCLVLSGCGVGAPNRIEIQPASVAVNAPCTQHEIVAHVTDAKGKPICNCLVEWTLPRTPGAVGAIVETPDLWGSKKTNTYARTRTDQDGKARITITSTKEGRTPIVALVPWIADKKYHKVFAVKHWSKAAWKFPASAQTRVGERRHITTYVYQDSCDDAEPSPLPGYRVEWEILANFNITDQSLEDMKSEGIPDDVLSKLHAIKNQEVEGEREFLEKVVEQIGHAATAEHTSIILKYTKRLIGPLSYLHSSKAILSGDTTAGQHLQRIEIETDTNGLAQVQLSQSAQAPGENKLRIRIKHPDHLKEICCPKGNDVLATWNMTQIWIPAN